MTLSASLAQCTKMIADFRGRAGGPSWKINSSWLPRTWQELNPLHYFESRVRRRQRALVDLEPPMRGTSRVFLGDSRSLDLPDDSVDYVFTDPPYGGEGIQYGELSMLWGLWLGDPSRLATEVAYNPYRDFDQHHYATGLASVFTEVARVLKPGGFATIAFANKDPEVWNALLTACRGAGFALEGAVPMRRSAPGLTESTMRRAPKADLPLTFQLDPLRPLPSVRNEPYPLPQRNRTLWSKLRNAQPDADTHHLLDRVLIDWISWLYDGRAPTRVTRPTLDTIEDCFCHDPS